jgi:hypothetical protein
MTEPEQNAAIATECGWEVKPRLLHNGEWKDIPTWVESKYYEGKPEDYCMAGQGIGQQPPRYCADLNLMHEAEKSLESGHDYWKFVEWTISIVKRDDLPFIKDGVSATAKQRAEAFLRTIGKWKD